MRSRRPCRARDVHQRKSAERQGLALAEAQALHIGKLQRAAAKIAHDAIGLIEARGRAERRKLRLATARQKLDGSADGLARGLEELLAIGGVARRRRRQHMDVADLHEIAEHPEPPQGAKRLRHAVFGQLARHRNAPTKAAQQLVVEDRRWRPRQALIGDEAHGVRTDVDDGDRLADGEPPRRIKLREAFFEVHSVTVIAVS